MHIEENITISLLFQHVVKKNYTSNIFMEMYILLSCFYVSDYVFLYGMLLCKYVMQLSCVSSIKMETVGRMFFRYSTLIIPIIAHNKHLFLQ